MGKDGFQLMSYSEKTDVSFQYVPVMELIAKQRKEAAQILSEVIKELNVKDEEHKSKFRSESLKETFHLVLYAFEKISEELRGAQPVILSKWAVENCSLRSTTLNRYSRRRGMGVETYDSVKFHYGEIEYPLGELRKFFDGEPSEIASQKAARVYAEGSASLFHGIDGHRGRD